MMIEERDCEVLTGISPLKEQKVSPAHRLSFAKSILCGLALLFFAGMLLTVFARDAEIFDACKTVLPPIATLIIGYYFGEKHRE